MSLRKTTSSGLAKGKKKSHPVGVSSLSGSQPTLTPQQQLMTIPVVADLTNIPGIQPYLLPGLIPDLLYIVQTQGREGLLDAIRRANPGKPDSIIFNNASQEVHAATREIEIDIIRNEPEVEEREDIQCRCGSRRVQVVIVQIRSGDEPPTVFARCITCKHQWPFSAA